jgi:hypothetical protein
LYAATCVQKQKAWGLDPLLASVPIHWRVTEVSIAFVAMTPSSFFLPQSGKNISSQSTGVNVIPNCLYWMKHLLWISLPNVAILLEQVPPQMPIICTFNL